MLFGAFSIDVAASKKKCPQLMEKADLGQKKSVERFQMNFASVVFRFFSRLVEVKFFEAF